MVDTFRQLNNHELAILQRLLQADFPGVRSLRTQLSGLLIRQIESEQSLELKVGTEIRALVIVNPPVEASYCDRANEDPSGVQVRIRLHVHNGLMHELEIFKDDGSQVIRMPQAEELLVHVNAPGLVK